MQRISLFFGPLIFGFLFFGCASLNRHLAQTTAEIGFQKSCLQDEPRQKLRAEELQIIVQADQADRKDWQNINGSRH